jgi:nucleoside-diphosphate kinase
MAAIKSKKLEQTLILIKPDALKNSLTGYILSQMSEYHTGLRFAGAKVVHVSRMLAEEHYAEHRGKVFFPSLIEFIRGRIHYPDEPRNHRVMAFALRGPNAVKRMRDIVGPTNPHEAREQQPGCIRSLGTVVPITDSKGKIIGTRMDNLIHASATIKEAEREIKIWFRPDDIPPFMHAYPTAACDDFYYINDSKLHKTPRKGSICVLSKGQTAWKSDLKALSLLAQGKKAPLTVEAVVAKYIINSVYEKD